MSKPLTANKDINNKPIENQIKRESNNNDINKTIISNLINIDSSKKPCITDIGSKDIRKHNDINKKIISNPINTDIFKKKLTDKAQSHAIVKPMPYKKEIPKISEKPGTKNNTNSKHK